MSTLFDFLPIGAYRSTESGRMLHANAALVRLNGYEREEDLLSGVNDIGQEWYVDPQRRSQFQALLERDGQVVDFVSEVYWPNRFFPPCLRHDFDFLTSGNGMTSNARFYRLQRAYGMTRVRAAVRWLGVTAGWFGWFKWRNLWLRG